MERRTFLQVLGSALGVVDTAGAMPVSRIKAEERWALEIEHEGAWKRIGLISCGTLFENKAGILMDFNERDSEDMLNLQGVRHMVESFFPALRRYRVVLGDSTIEGLGYLTTFERIHTPTEIYHPLRRWKSSQGPHFESAVRIVSVRLVIDFIEEGESNEGL